MKKGIILLLTMALLLIFVLPIPVMAAGHTVDICHVNATNGVWYSPQEKAVVQFGRAITIAVDAESTHLAHGDGHIWFTVDSHPTLFAYAEAAGAVGNGNCGINLTPI